MKYHCKIYLTLNLRFHYYGKRYIQIELFKWQELILIFYTFFQFKTIEWETYSLTKVQNKRLRFCRMMCLIISDSLLILN